MILEVAECIVLGLEKCFSTMCISDGNNFCLLITSGALIIGLSI
jgi:hypothetical protein